MNRAIAAAMLALALQTAPGPVRELTFEPAPDGNGQLIHWQPPSGLEPALVQQLIYEVQDQGEGPWRPVHEGPETRLRVLELRQGSCRLRVRAVAPGLGPGPWEEADCTLELDRRAHAEPATAAPCDETGPAACLLAGRFAVRVYRISNGIEIDAVADAAERLEADARWFRFEDDGSTAVQVRILDLCSRNGHFGLEYRVHGSLGFRVAVHDLDADRKRSFLAPAGRDRPGHVAFNEVFATCG